MDPTLFTDITFPKHHERCFDYNLNPVVVTELDSIFRDPTMLKYFEERIVLDISEESFDCLFRCHSSADEREKEMEGLKENKVYMKDNYYNQREEGHVSKTDGPGAYFLEGISECVYERKPYCFLVLFDSSESHRTARMSESLYNRYVFCILYPELQGYVHSSTIQILFSYWLKNIKGVNVLKISETAYEYPIVVFL